MKVTYEITQDDFLNAYERFWRSNKQGSTTAYILGCAAILLGVLTHIPFERVRPFSLALAIAGILCAALPLIRHHLFRRAFQGNPKYGAPIESDFSEVGISVKTAVGNSNLRWDLYQRALETADAFLLPFTKNAFSIIPKRSFESEGEIETFRSLLRNHLGQIREI